MQLSTSDKYKMLTVRNRVANKQLIIMMKSTYSAAAAAMHKTDARKSYLHTSTSYISHTYATSFFIIIIIQC